MKRPIEVAQAIQTSSMSSAVATTLTIIGMGLGLALLMAAEPWVWLPVSGLAVLLLAYRRVV